ncbi:aquaporin [Streptomyces bobili]|uniref:aquaporin n=1 Tax=Streptomyces bobili TaxID=67280 RepID=UPI0034224F99
MPTAPHTVKGVMPGLRPPATGMTENTYLQRLLAEFLGTAFLVFLGVSSIPATIMLQKSGNTSFTMADPGVIAFAFAMVVVAAVFAIGHVSAAISIRRSPWHWPRRAGFPVVKWRDTCRGRSRLPSVRRRPGTLGRLGSCRPAGALPLAAHGGRSGRRPMTRWRPRRFPPNSPRPTSDTLSRRDASDGPRSGPAARLPLWA